MKINIAKIKGLGKDEYGYDKVIYLTKSQVEVLGKMRNDPEQRYRFVRVGSLMFSPMDIMFIEEVERGLYELPKYTMERLEKEKDEEIRRIDKSTDRAIERR